jgi:hypothetical protein
MWVGRGAAKKIVFIFENISLGRYCIGLKVNSFQVALKHLNAQVNSIQKNLMLLLYVFIIGQQCNINGSYTETLIIMSSYNNLYCCQCYKFNNKTIMRDQ